MVNDLDKKYINFHQAYEALSRAIKTQQRLMEKEGDDSDVADLLSSGVIQHFELAYETLWKFLKQYLEARHEIEVASPRETFRACYKYKLLPEDLVNELMQLADARNKTTHQYNRILAQLICNDVIKHQHVMGTILNLIKLP